MNCERGSDVVKSGGKQPVVPANSDARGPVEPANSDARRPVEPANSDARRPVEPANSDARRPVKPANSDARRPVEPANSDAKRPVGVVKSGAIALRDTAESGAARSAIRLQWPSILLLLFLLGSRTGGLGVPASHAQDAGTRYALIIGGLGGDADYTARFSDYLSETHSLLVNRYGIPDEQVFVLAENSIVERPFVDDASTALNIRSYFDRLSRQVTPDDHVYVVLFGHGSYDGTSARLNIPRRDLDDADYGELLDNLQAGRIVFVNTASASGPFTLALSGPDRIVITATATGTERDETVFPRYFIEALRSMDSDIDKSGSVSVLELFRYAAGESARSFEASGHLATEHALIEDSGDGVAARFDEIDGSDDGALASITYLRPPDALAQIDESDRPLLRERESLQRSIAELKTRKEDMSDDSYYAELESLLVRLARLNARLEGD